MFHTPSNVVGKPTTHMFHYTILQKTYYCHLAVYKDTIVVSMKINLTLCADWFDLKIKHCVVVRILGKDNNVLAGVLS